VARTLTVKQAAELAGVSERTIRNRIYSGDIRALKKDGKFGPAYFIPESEVIRSATMDAELFPSGGKPLPQSGAASAETMGSELASVVRDLSDQLREQAEQIGRFKALAERSQALETSAETFRAERDRAMVERTQLELRLAALAAERDTLKAQAQHHHGWFGLSKRRQRLAAAQEGSARA
jgi:excisionase family DNA binding protein